MTEPLVSICCVTFNHEPYIRKCLDGFLMQKTTFPIEILIHDDASTDKTADIIREYEAKYPDLIFPIYETENKYSHGFETRMDFFNYNRARGKYIAYCEGDDYWTDPLKLQKQVDFLESHPDYSLCLHNFHDINSTTGQITYPRHYDILKNGEEGMTVDVHDYFYTTLIQPLTLVFRKSMFDFDWVNHYKYYRDTHEIYHLLRAGKGYWMNFDGGVYVKHSEGISSGVTQMESCVEEREHILELYLYTQDRFFENYLVEVLLWNYKHYRQENRLSDFENVLNEFEKKVPKIVRKVRLIIFKRRFKHRLAKMRFQPIRVFCFHQTSDEFDPVTMRKVDWISKTDLLAYIRSVQKQGYKFISLQEAYSHLKNDRFRLKKYAVLTADDGTATLKNILPWLKENNIPIVLFINSKMTDGKSYREDPNEQYLTLGELKELSTQKGIEIESHGHQHINAEKISGTEFEQNIQKDLEILEPIVGQIKFHAYTYGGHNRNSDAYLKKIGIIPVLVDGQKNYNDADFIHRELIK